MIEMQADMLAKARKTFDEHLKIVYEWKDFVPTLNSNSVVVMPWCEVEACEDAIKDRSAREYVPPPLFFSRLTIQIGGRDRGRKSSFVRR